MRVKPAEGRAVRFPASKRLLKTEGEDVPDTMFWRRRLRDGDIEVVNTVVEASATEVTPSLPHEGKPDVTSEAAA
ncbi:hypothetical protein AA103196_2273 [Ameyamaea chiangmaiensis NBRC 103196]|uniref:DUF2635 domain-containing protein n=1 Tax=Ameyamaea chiangmaiensis TaxID=442969 RepID=A0A850P8V3_9PROT|nr:DUF2635 domain-containing protein [Ameyamaea chiangmaiensis]MBS4075468.1 DUF2635 domain-containing protein [Ameyamaea chiangmaiensis]NVN39000.1 DUF2635 domain-containing protein [Ameyamaea chiangmaiensis]GBQ69659.1 hypothetical protein AA103196_2273 [Ameyamaea chiangmaiensis NBRC 103196]